MLVRHGFQTGLTALAVGAAAMATSVTAAVGAASHRVTLVGSVAQVAASGAGSGTVALSRPQTIEVWLAGDESGAQAFVDGVSTPGSGSFHQYLSPEAYMQRFGASAASAAAVRSWLSSEGMSDVAVSPGRDYVSATASTAKVEKAFGTQMRIYAVSADGKRRTIQSNDSALSIPAALARDVLSVTGLNSTPPISQTTSTSTSTTTPSTPCSHYWGQHTVTLNPPLNGLTAAGTPVCGYSADQMRAAYGQTMANDGRGVTIALIERGTPTAMGQTLADYARSNGLPAPAPRQFRELHLSKPDSKCGNFSDHEEQLDSESAYAMAPGADQLMIDGNPCQAAGEQAVFNAEMAPLIGNGQRPSATIESASIELPDNFSTSEYQTQHAILLRAAAEGVGMYFASGDYLGVEPQVSDPDETAVGGTTLGIGAEDPVLFQTGWSDNTETLTNDAWQEFGILGAAGGGASPRYAEPAYQKGVVPASMSDVDGRMARTIPDISADADGDTGMLIGEIDPTSSGTPGPYTTVAEGGTSMATPLVAGMVADAQQGQPRSFGFINPLLYSLSKTSAITDVLPPSSSEPQTDRNLFTTGTIDSGIGAPIDDQFGITPPLADGDQVIAPGYDTVTGLGTPNGQAFVWALRSRCWRVWHSHS